jgi:hypothetical protein
MSLWTPRGCRGGCLELFLDLGKERSGMPATQRETHFTRCAPSYPTVHTQMVFHVYNIYSLHCYCEKMVTGSPVSHLLRKPRKSKGRQSSRGRCQTANRRAYCRPRRISSVTARGMTFRRFGASGRG